MLALSEEGDLGREEERGDTFTKGRRASWQEPLVSPALAKSPCPHLSTTVIAVLEEETEAQSG